jgi:hypothetical protein
MLSMDCSLRELRWERCSPYGRLLCLLLMKNKPRVTNAASATKAPVTAPAMTPVDEPALFECLDRVVDATVGFRDEVGTNFGVDVGINAGVDEGEEPFKHVLSFVKPTVSTSELPP